MATRNDVEAFLAHYADPDYDPEAARRYYLRTRKLKGRKPGKKLLPGSQRRTGQAGRAQEQLAKAATPVKKASLKPQTQEQQITSLQKAGEAAVIRIQTQLDDFLSQISAQTPIPADASPKLRAFLEKQQLARAKGKVREANAEVRKIGLGLKEAIAKAKADTQSSKKSTAKAKTSTAKKPVTNRSQQKVTKPRTTTKQKPKARSKPKTTSTAEFKAKQVSGLKKRAV